MGGWSPTFARTPIYVFNNGGLVADLRPHPDPRTGGWSPTFARTPIWVFSNGGLVTDLRPHPDIKTGGLVTDLRPHPLFACSSVVWVSRGAVGVQAPKRGWTLRLRAGETTSIAGCWETTSTAVARVLASLRVWELHSSPAK